MFTVLSYPKIIKRKTFRCDKSIKFEFKFHSLNRLNPIPSQAFLSSGTGEEDQIMPSGAASSPSRTGAS